MVLDTSALLAILGDEPERRSFTEAMEAAETRKLSAASLVEVSVVVAARYGSEGLRDLDYLLAKAEVEVVPVDAEHATAARRGFVLFGKGRHAAGLNFGDCFAYGLGRVTSEPLLFRGNDFARTDVAAWMP